MGDPTDNYLLPTKTEIDLQIDKISPIIDTLLLQESQNTRDFWYPITKVHPDKVQNLNLTIPQIEKRDSDLDFLVSRTIDQTNFLIARRNNSFLFLKDNNISQDPINMFVDYLKAINKEVEKPLDLEFTKYGRKGDKTLFYIEDSIVLQQAKIGENLHYAYDADTIIYSPKNNLLVQMETRCILEKNLKTNMKVNLIEPNTLTKEELNDIGIMTYQTNLIRHLPD